MDRTTCVCGSNIATKNLPRHLKSKKHLEYKPTVPPRPVRVSQAPPRPTTKPFINRNGDPLYNCIPCQKTMLLKYVEAHNKSKNHIAQVNESSNFVGEGWTIKDRLLLPHDRGFRTQWQVSNLTHKEEEELKDKRDQNKEEFKLNPYSDILTYKINIKEVLFTNETNRRCPGYNKKPFLIDKYKNVLDHIPEIYQKMLT